MARRNTKDGHPGVFFSKNEAGSLVARWKDPDTGRERKVSLRALGYTTKAQAMGWMREKSLELREMLERIRIGGPRRMVAADWETLINEYGQYFRSEHSEKSWHRLLAWYLAPAFDYLTARARRPGDLDARHLADWRIHARTLRRRETRGKENHAAHDAQRSATTVNRHIGALKAMLEWARRMKYLRISGDDIRDTLPIFRVEYKAPTVLSPSEMTKLLRGVVRHDQARHFASKNDKRAYYSGVSEKGGSTKFSPLGPFLLVGLLTGARPGEVTAMRWRDVDFEREEMRVMATKTGRERIVPLCDSPALKATLRGLQLKAQGSPFVIPGPDADTPKMINRLAWKRLLDLAGLEGRFPPKVMRSTCVAYVASAGLDSEYLLEARFGHGATISRKHYRRPMHGATGSTVEACLGVEDVVWETIRSLGLAPERESASIPG